MFRKQLLDSSRGRIVSLLQHGELTIDQIASQLALTPNAVRAQITGMERDGVVQRIGLRAGITRPSQVYQLTGEVEQLLSRAYVPVLTQLVRVFASRLPAEQMEEALREAGRALADELLSGRRPSGSLEARIDAASGLLNTQLGAVTRVEKNGEYMIQGRACPLAAVTGKHPAVCMAMEELIAEVVGVPVNECCDRADRPRCCFKIASE